jgi:hypothetical protein
MLRPAAFVEALAGAASSGFSGTASTPQRAATELNFSGCSSRQSCNGSVAAGADSPAWADNALQKIKTQAERAVHASRNVVLRFIAHAGQADQV